MVNAKKLDENEFVKCPVCGDLLPKDSLDEVDEVFECSECGEIYDNQQDAESCCEDEEGDD